MHDYKTTLSNYILLTSIFAACLIIGSYNQQALYGEQQPAVEVNEPESATGTFYLRSCKTGRLIGPVSLKPGSVLPSLDDKNYIIANPTESELSVRKCLLETNTFESHYNVTLPAFIETINKMLKHRLKDKAPLIRIDIPKETRLPIIETSIYEEPAYEVLCRIAAITQVRISIEQGEVVLSQKELKEVSDLQTNMTRSNSQ